MYGIKGLNFLSPDSSSDEFFSICWLLSIEYWADPWILCQLRDSNTLHTVDHVVNRLYIPFATHILLDFLNINATMPLDDFDQLCTLFSRPSLWLFSHWTRSVASVASIVARPEIKLVHWHQLRKFWRDLASKLLLKVLNHLVELALQLTHLDGCQRLIRSCKRQLLLEYGHLLLQLSDLFLEFSTLTLELLLQLEHVRAVSVELVETMPKLCDGHLVTIALAHTVQYHLQELLVQLRLELLEHVHTKVPRLQLKKADGLADLTAEVRLRVQ